MPIKFSTGQGTRMRHSTALDWDEWEKKRRHPWVRYSTSKQAAIRHNTGTAFDLETPDELSGKEGHKADGVHSSRGVHSKPTTETDGYLAAYAAARAKREKGS